MRHRKRGDLQRGRWDRDVKRRLALPHQYLQTPVAVIFDDAYEHEAWNNTSDTRVVLLVDFRKPLRFPANLINWLLLHLAVFTPFMREGIDKQKAWERKFYAESEAPRNRWDFAKALLDLALNRG